MKEKLTALLIILIFGAFLCFQFLLSIKTPVLNVITPSIIQVDLNSNRIVDDNETICAAGVNAFTANLTKFSDELAKSSGLSYEKALAVGYLTDELANKILLENEVKLKFTGVETPECREAQVYLGRKSYADILNDKGFSLKSPQFNNMIERASKLNLVIYNHKSKKYHTLVCKYGKIAHDAVVLLQEELPEEAKPCKFCHIKREPQQIVKHFNHKNEIIPAAPSIITDGSAKLILTDFTNILKPSKDCSHAVCKEFVSLINSSDSSIDIALYGWANIPQIVNALKNAEKRGVTIRMVYDYSTNKANYYPETDDIIKMFVNTRPDKVENSAKLTNMLMHNKFAIFDNKRIYTGSMNFSSTGLSGFNQNNVIIINSEQVASLYSNEFNQMYCGKFHTLKTKTPQNAYIIDGNKYSVFFSPQDKQITNNVIPLVNNAKQYIFIPAFLITHKDLTDSLIKAYQRGVDVKIIVDATNTSGRNSKFKLLRDSGVPVKVENYAGKMHTKSIIIDNKYLVIGSANFSNSGENKNDENMLIIENPRMTKFYRDFFLYLWQKIPDSYLKHTVRAESKYSIGSCFDGIDNNFDGKIDSADVGCK